MEIVRNEPVDTITVTESSAFAGSSYRGKCLKNCFRTSLTETFNATGSLSFILSSTRYEIVWESEAWLHSFLILTLEGGDWSS